MGITFTLCPLLNTCSRSAWFTFLMIWHASFNLETNLESSQNNLSDCHHCDRNVRNNLLAPTDFNQQGHEGKLEIQWFGHYHNRLRHLQWQSTKWMNYWHFGLCRSYEAFYMKLSGCPTSSLDNHSQLASAWLCDRRNERCYECTGCDCETLTRPMTDQCRTSSVCRVMYPHVSVSGL